MGHVGNGHENGWQKAVRTPREIHQTATAHDPDAARKVARVNYYFHRQGVLDAVSTWYDHGYKTVQIEPEGYLPGDEWTAFQQATDVTGIRRVGDRRYCATDDILEDLPEPPAEGQCSYPGCGRDGPQVTVAVKDGEAAMLCPTHRKEFWGVSS